MKAFPVIAFILLTICCWGQKEDYNWYFGATGAGLNFDGCQITVLSNGGMSSSTFEGTVAISDEQTGQLLFYTNGLNIYTANHTMMQNGFQAALSTSITQNIIIRKPGSNSIYYLFTADVQGGITQNPSYPTAIGINYAIIDMSQNGGAGRVVSPFNSLKDTSNCEKLTAVRHANGQDIWLIGHEYGNNNYFVYSITAAGIDTVPQFFPVGPEIYTPQSGIPANSRYDAIGELKASPDGNRLALTSYYNGYTVITDFDNTAGIISNPISLNINGGGYGLSFNPQGDLLYIGISDTNTAGGLPDTARLSQFNLQSGDSATIQQSEQVIYACGDCGFASMKLAPTGTIIVAHYGTYTNFTGDPYLGIIYSPDSMGIACNYVHNGISLNGEPSSWGLNNLMENPNYCIPAGTVQPEEVADWLLQPNPFTEEMMLSGKNLNAVSLRIYNTFGQLVKEVIPDLEQQQEIHITGLSTLPSGVYLTEIRSEKQRAIIKGIKL
ncbi:MAG TPA: T9SS type A sorting domain-containing protein [Chitinophagaceae bacterium]|nr:T9SS type A sorting domain-containing protein [Chitinophagaceae bacterium]